MKRLFALAAALAFLSTPALADYSYTQGSGTTVKAGTLAGAVLPWFNPVDASGNPLTGTLAPGASPTSGFPVLCEYVAAGVSLTTTQSVGLQCTSTGSLHTTLDNASIAVTGTFWQATQPISGSVTANAGTNLNTSLLALESGGNLAGIKTDVDNLNLSQGSTTSGQKGNLNLGAVTTGAPTYTTAQTSPLSLTTAGALRTDASATTQPVSGSVSAAQSGTWTVQPGNTANSTAWLVTGAGGLFPASQSGTWNINNVSGTVSLPTGAATAALQPTNAAQGSTTSGQTGRLTLGAVTTSAPSYTTGQTSPLSLDPTGALRVNVTAGGGSGGTSSSFGSAFPSVGTAAGLEYLTSPPTLTTGNMGALQGDVSGNLKVNIQGCASAVCAPLGQTTMSGSAPVTIASDQSNLPTNLKQVNGSTLALGSTTQSASLPVVIASDQTAADPCMYQAKSSLPISTNATALTQIIAASGSTKIYICSIALVAPGATAFSLNTGTGTNCGTSTAAVVGSTTAANGMSFAANGGFQQGNGQGTIAVANIAGAELCTLQSNAVQVAGVLTYVQR